MLALEWKTTDCRKTRHVFFDEAIGIFVDFNVDHVQIVAFAPTVELVGEWLELDCGVAFADENLQHASSRDVTVDLLFGVANGRSIKHNKLSKK